jgi:hypothetical protein
MNREDLCRSLPREHSPLIARDWPRIVGCTCGWRTPSNATDSDTTFTEHAAFARVVEGGAR